MSVEKKFQYNNANVYAEVFSGINEMLRTIENRPVPSQWSMYAHIYTEPGTTLKKRFCGYGSYAAARKAILAGHNITDMKKARHDGLGDFEKVKTIRADRGSLPCIPAYLSNDPRAMYVRRPQRTKGAYNVFVSVSVPSYVTSEEVLEAGKRILTYITKLEQEQPVNLYVGNIVEAYGKYDAFAVKIKDAGKPFNASRVSFSLTDVGLLRVFGFLWQERNENTTPDSGYGCVVSGATLDGIVGKIFKNTISISLWDEVKGR